MIWVWVVWLPGGGGVHIVSGGVHAVGSMHATTKKVCS